MMWWVITNLGKLLQTSLERAHSITWHKQKRRRNRWASKLVSQGYIRALLDRDINLQYLIYIM